MALASHNTNLQRHQRGSEELAKVAIVRASLPAYGLSRRCDDAARERLESGLFVCKCAGGRV